MTHRNAVLLGSLVVAVVVVVVVFFSRIKPFSIDARFIQRCRVKCNENEYYNKNKNKKNNKKMKTELKRSHHINKPSTDL